MRFLIVLVLASPAFADWLDEPKVTIHDYRGRPCAIEESSDASTPRRTEKAKATSTPTKAPEKGGEAVSGALLLSTAPSPVFYNGVWWQWEGSSWRQLTARSVPQVPFGAVTTAPVAVVQSTPLPVGYPVASTYIAAPIRPVARFGGISFGVSAGACVGGG